MHISEKRPTDSARYTHKAVVVLCSTTTQSINLIFFTSFANRQRPTRDRLVDGNKYYTMHTWLIIQITLPFLVFILLFLQQKSLHHYPSLLTRRWERERGVCDKAAILRHSFMMICNPKKIEQWMMTFFVSPPPPFFPSKTTTTIVCLSIFAIFAYLLMPGMLNLAFGWWMVAGFLDASLMTCSGSGLFPVYWKYSSAFIRR